MSLSTRFVFSYCIYRHQSTSFRRFLASNYVVNVISQRCLTDDSLPILTESVPRSITKAETISKAMQAYLRRAKQHETFMKEQTVEYEIGKRHLANIMGAEPESFSQEDVDAAIEYLMPSGLFNKKARPLLKHPSHIFPPAKAVQFDFDGRPFHYMFYTGMPNFYETMHQAATKLEALKKAEEEYLWKGEELSAVEAPLNIQGSVWITHEELKKRMLENLPLVEYRRFVMLMERLSDHSLAAKEHAFIMMYRTPLATQSLAEELQQPLIDENGNEYAEAKGQRKSAEASVQLWLHGNGSFMVNGVVHLYEYFPRYMDRLQIMTPLQFTGMLGKVTVVASVRDGGPSGQAGALRLAISRALCTFVSTDVIERMRLAGLLTRDPRIRERKKPGQEGARRKFAWRKR